MEGEVAGPGHAGPRRERQVVERRAGVGEEHRANHPPRPGRGRLVLQVSAEGRGRHRRRGLDEVAERRHGGGGRVLQAVAGGNREREELVGPQVLAGREKYSRQRGDGHDEQDRAQGRPECLHGGCLLMDAERRAR